jgi:hypothetical protein
MVGFNFILPIDIMKIWKRDYFFSTRTAECNSCPGHEF